MVSPFVPFRDRIFVMLASRRVSPDAIKCVPFRDRKCLRMNTYSLNLARMGLAPVRSFLRALLNIHKKNFNAKSPRRKEKKQKIISFSLKSLNLYVFAP